VMPSNEGRGYVLRRVLRRAALFGKNLGVDKPFLAQIAEVVIARMGHVHPELVANGDRIVKAIDMEEARFAETLGTGLRILGDIMQQAKGVGETVSGEEVFRLYDTYGFPPELTAEVAAENGLTADLEGFEQEMERQRERARAAQKFAADVGLGAEVVASLVKSEEQFVGYDKLKHKSKLVGLMINRQAVEAASMGQDVEVILQETPLYGEMGGQVGDTGGIRGPNGRITVTNSIWPNVIVHHGSVVEGTISVDDIVEAEVDEKRRLDIARNHTATHLLQAALRQVLGSHVHQMGSLVAPDHFRFDFSFEAPVLKEELDQIQRIVN